MSERRPGRTLVLGLGNPIMGDDGFGLALLERLLEGWALPAGVEAMDGGIWGMKLLPQIEQAERLLLLDAINAGLPPGTPVVLERAELPRYFALKLSPHQIDLREVLALAELRGTLPRDLIAVGAQPARLELGTELSRELAERVDEVAALAAARLERWGQACPRRAGPVSA